jgi:hypothetical protein
MPRSLASRLRHAPGSNVRPSPFRSLHCRSGISSAAGGRIVAASTMPTLAGRSFSLEVLAHLEGVRHLVPHGEIWAA